MSPDQLQRAIGCDPGRAATWSEPITAAMAAYNIDTPARIAAFLAQIAHESGRLRYVREIWGPTPAQERYEGRQDLGNKNPGDGKKFMGRGLIQVTGRDNYLRTAAALGIEDILSHPERLEEPAHAANSAAEFWKTHGCNELADAGDFIRITRLINGGVNGLADRQAIWERCKVEVA